VIQHRFHSRAVRALFGSDCELHGLNDTAFDVLRKVIVMANDGDRSERERHIGRQ
jgi:hypothetical protein